MSSLRMNIKGEKLPFLDVSLITTGNNIEKMVERKPTNSNTFLNWKSLHMKKRCFKNINKACLRNKFQ